MKILSTLFIYSAICFAQIPSINIQFGGSLNQSCDYVNNADVINSLQNTMSVLSQIQESEVACQNILINAKAFINSSLSASIQRQKDLYASQENKEIIEAMIKEKTQTSLGYQGELDFELLTAEKEIALLKNSQYIDQVNINQTMLLGSTVFDDLANSPIQCSHSFGQDILAPAIAITGQSFSAVNPAIGAVGQLLSSIITYTDRVLKPSYRSFKRLTQESNFHLTYKCAAKNIEKIICNLEDQEKTIEEIQASDNSDYLDKYKEMVLSYDTDDNQFREYFHMLRHRYRIAKIIQDLENIFRSPETAQDLNTVGDYQNYFSTLENIPRLNPLENQYYVEAMNSNGRENPSLQTKWFKWSNNLVQWSQWYSVIRSSPAMVNQIDRNCQTIDTKIYKELVGVYNAGRNDCQAFGMTREAQITQFVQAVIVPSLVFIQDEITRINTKIRTNANIHALYTNVNNQQYNVGNADYKEYNLSELTALYTKSAQTNINGSLKLYAQDMVKIMKAISDLTDDDVIEPKNFSEFAKAANDAYFEIARVSNNGADVGILFRSIVQSKISDYLDGIRENYIFHSDEKLAQNFVNFIFYANDYQDMVNQTQNPDSAGSSNLSLMGSIKAAYIKTFSRVISKVMNGEIKRYKSNNNLKRSLTHSCAIFLPMMDSNFKGKTRSIKSFCENLIKSQGGLKLSQNSTNVYPLKNSKGQSFNNRCYYNNYEEAVMRYQINKAKRNRSRNRI